MCRGTRLAIPMVLDRGDPPSVISMYVIFTVDRRRLPLLAQHACVALYLVLYVGLIARNVEGCVFIGLNAVWCSQLHPPFWRGGGAVRPVHQFCHAPRSRSFFRPLQTALDPKREGPVSWGWFFFQHAWLQRTWGFYLQLHARNNLRIFRRRYSFPSRSRPYHQNKTPVGRAKSPENSVLPTL